MASHVVVIDSSYRRATIKTTPTTYLSDVLSQACEKLNLRSEQYDLKYNNKNLDLSLMLRYASLPPGANIHLVQGSRSPSAVAIALQLPASEDNARLTDKFPSTTSFWQILRRFEAGTAGASSARHTNYNFTQRGVPQMKVERSNGPGRMNYEMPVIQVMTRELDSFEDLQKTLAQCGLNGGSALLRLSFKDSGKPLEKAMADISLFFKDEDKSAKEAAGVETTPAPAADTPSDVAPRPESTAAPQTDVKTEALLAESKAAPLTTESERQAPKTELNVDGPDHRPMTVFAAPAKASPNDPRFKFNEADYEPTTDHARLHQARLNTESRNKRLPSDAEIAATEKAKQEKLAAIADIRIRVRLPDQTQVEAKFTHEDSSSNLHDWIISMLQNPDAPFLLRYPGPKGLLETLENGPKKLVKGFGLKGSTLMVFAWHESASALVRQQPVLKAEYRQQAQQIKVEVPAVAAAKEEPKQNVMSKLFGNNQSKSSGGSSSGGKEAKLKKLLGFGKGKK